MCVCTCVCECVYICITECDYAKKTSLPYPTQTELWNILSPRSLIYTRSKFPPYLSAR